MTAAVPDADANAAAAVRGGGRPDLTKRGLSQPRQRLLSLAQRMYFGRVLRLVVRGGEPLFDPQPTLVRRVKLGGGGSNTPRPQAASEDFALKREWVEFFAHLDAAGDGTVLLLEVAHGLPLYFELEDPPLAAPATEARATVPA